jgi:hypothetical protein
MKRDGEEGGEFIVLETVDVILAIWMDRHGQHVCALSLVAYKCIAHPNYVK